MWDSSRRTQDTIRYFKKKTFESFLSEILPFLPQTTIFARIRQLAGRFCNFVAQPIIQIAVGFQGKQIFQISMSTTYIILYNDDTSCI